MPLQICASKLRIGFGKEFMAYIGYISLFLALLASIYSAIAFTIGAIGGRRQALIDSARNRLLAATGLISISAVILIVAFLTHNFQIEYVAMYSSSDSPLAYLISGLWAGTGRYCSGHGSFPCLLQ